MAGDVACRPHARVARAQVLVDSDRSPLGQLDSRLVESHRLAVRPPPGRDQNIVDRNLAAGATVLEAQPSALPIALHRPDLHLREHRRAFLLEDRLHRLGHLWSFERRDSGHSFEESDLAAEAHEQLPQLQRRGAGQITGLFQAFDRRDRRRCAGGDQVGTSPQTLASAFDRLRINELSQALADREAVRPGEIHILLRPQLPDQLCLGVDHCAEVEAVGRGLNTHEWMVAGSEVGIGRRQHRLGGDAADVDAGTADDVRLHHGDAASGLGRPDGRQVVPQARGEPAHPEPAGRVRPDLPAGQVARPLRVRLLQIDGWVDIGFGESQAGGGDSRGA